MLKLLSLLLVVSAGPLAAQTQTLPQPDTVEECDICTARHKSLQALQKARTETGIASGNTSDRGEQAQDAPDRTEAADD